MSNKINTPVTLNLEIVRAALAQATNLPTTLTELRERLIGHATDPDASDDEVLAYSLAICHLELQVARLRELADRWRNPADRADVLGEAVTTDQILMVLADELLAVIGYSDYTGDAPQG
jgi:hypothetical protein